MRLSADIPYPGLRQFDESDADYFFGRGEHILDLQRRVRDKAFTAVVGASGSGKSSLVRAGLIPALRRSTERRWRCLVFRPQSDPYGNLARDLLREIGDDGLGEPVALARLTSLLQLSSEGLGEAITELGLETDERVLIVVDQFEELIRFDQDNVDTSLKFIRMLLRTAAQHGAQVSTLITMRLDFLADCARYPGLTEQINDGQYLVPTLNRFQRTAAIIEPARKSGRDIEWSLVQTIILNDADDAQDQLPVMQHGLMRLWFAAGDDEKIDLDHYRKIGTLKKAISRHANDIFESLGTAEQQTAEHLFKALTELDKQERGIRRPQRVRAICAALGLQGGASDRLLYGDDADVLSAQAGASPSDSRQAERERICRLFAGLAEFGAATGEAVGPDSLRRFAADHGLGDEDLSWLEGYVRLIRVIEAFRAPPAFFLMPPAPKPLQPDIVVDITHESLIRQWPQISGTSTIRGWLQDEARDGRQYSLMVGDALGWRYDNFTLPGGPKLISYVETASADGHGARWGLRHLTSDMTRRLGGDIDQIDQLTSAFLTAAQRKARWERYLRYALLGTASAAALAITVVISLQYQNAELTKLNSQLVAERETVRLALAETQRQRAIAEEQTRVAQAALEEIRTLNLQLENKAEELQAQIEARTTAEEQTRVAEAESKQLGVTSLTAIAQRLQSQNDDVGALIFLRRALRLVLSQAVDPDVRLIAAGYNSLKTLREVAIADVGSSVFRLAQSPDQRRIAAGLYSRPEVVVLDATDLAVLGRIDLPETSGDGDVADVEYLPDGRTLAVLRKSGQVDVVSEDSVPIRRFPNEGKANYETGMELAVHPSGDWIVAADATQPGLRVLNVLTGTSSGFIPPRMETARPREDDGLWVLGMDFDGAGRRLVAGTSGGALLAFRFDDGKLSADGGTRSSEQDVPRPGRQGVAVVRFAPNGEWLATTEGAS